MAREIFLALVSIWLVGFVAMAFRASTQESWNNLVMAPFWPASLVQFLIGCVWPQRMPHEQDTAEAWAPELNSLRSENQDLRNQNAELHRKIASLNEDFVRLTKNYEAAVRTVRRVREAACDMTGVVE